ncbi:MAG TPA: endolytic transglycosylase MltG [Candidatus Dormibacteraeota bacterium]|nr:endolytic transglycosylase MltG [Candidatus Dormibacteraeota bacterium]
MTNYSARNSRKLMLTKLIVLLGAVFVLLITFTLAIRHVYDLSLGPVNNNPKTQIVTVKSGSSVKEIADLLHSKHLIRNAWAFEWYVHGQELTEKLQAGTYALASDESTARIVQTLTSGKVTTNLVTILPGRRIDQVQADLINDGFNPSAVDHALQPGLYTGLPVLAYKPTNVNSLEGLLFPDTFQKAADTDPEVIIRESLVEMGQKITPNLQVAFANEGLSIYQGITLASIVEQEVSKPNDRTQVAQVFLKRLANGMVLGSDVTANYGAIAAGEAPSLSYDSPYNTLLHNGLPPSPISTVSLSALQSTAHPANTDWLYFVTGDDGTTYFSHTLAEHQALTAQYCHKLCNN